MDLLRSGKEGKFCKLNAVLTFQEWLDDFATSETREIGLKVMEKEVEEIKKTLRPGYLEVVYHLYSMELKHGPVVLRLRTANRADQTRLPSLTPLWRGAEFQEREVYDLYGVVFEGHPDLRRILMWDNFVGFPMRRDYVAPDDFEYEPTPHDEVLAEAKKHYPAEVKP